MDTTIALVHNECQRSFEELCKSAKTQYHELTEQLEDELDKYKVWASNVGAAHSGPTFRYSLDYRLREATLFRDQVIMFLKILKENVERVAQVLDGKSDGLNPTTETPEYGPDDDDDSPWDISSSDDEPEEKRAAQRQPMQSLHNQHSVLFSTEEHSIGQGSEDLTSRLVSIQRVTTCLYRLPIRRPAPMDRLKDRSTGSTACFHFFDMSYVKDKFPSLDPDVAARLAKMITRRRQLLEYRKSHQQNISGSIQMEESQQNAPVTRDNMQGATTEKSDSGHRTLHSKATTLPQLPPPELCQLLAPSVVGSEALDSVLASEATRELKIEVPPRPLNKEDGSFKTSFCCPYCQMAVTVSSDDRWKKHVLADLQPYVCTHKDCSLPDHLFSDRDTWYAHEVQEHRVFLACGDDSHEPYTIPLEFQEHMERFHNMPLSESPSLLYNFRRPTQSPGGICNLCKQKTSSLKRHIARHLEQVALFSIPRADYTNDDEDLHEDQKSVSHGNAKGSVSNSLSELGSDTFDGTETISNESDSRVVAPGGEEDPSALEPVEQVDVPECNDPLWERISTIYCNPSTAPVPCNFHGWSFRKEREPGVEPSWSRARKTPLPYSSDELLRIVNQTTTTSATSNKKKKGKGTVSEQYSSIRSSLQRALVDGLLEAVKAEERNPNAEWTLACIEQDIAEYIRRDRGKVREVREMRVVLRRGPRRDVPSASAPTEEGIPGVIVDLHNGQGQGQGPHQATQSLHQQPFGTTPGAGPGPDGSPPGDVPSEFGRGAAMNAGESFSASKPIGVTVNLDDGQGQKPHQGTQPIHRQPARVGRDATPIMPLPTHDLPIPPPGPAAPSSGSHTPPSSISTRLNAKALKFQPNPAANTFIPGGNDKVEAPASRSPRGPGEPDPTSYAPSPGDRAPILSPGALDSDSE